MLLLRHTAADAVGYDTDVSASELIIPIAITPTIAIAVVTNGNWRD